MSLRYKGPLEGLKGRSGQNVIPTVPSADHSGRGRRALGSVLRCGRRTVAVRPRHRRPLRPREGHPQGMLPLRCGLGHRPHERLRAKPGGFLFEKRSRSFSGLATSSVSKIKADVFKACDYEKPTWDDIGTTCGKISD